MNVEKDVSSLDTKHQSDPSDQPPRPRSEKDNSNGKVLGESKPPQGHLTPIKSTLRSFSDDDVSIYAADNENERQRARLLVPTAARYHSLSPGPAPSWRAKCQTLWTANKGLALVLASQLFQAMMNVAARLLETADEPLSSSQVMFVRMAITLILCSVYMWWARVDHFPFGPKEVRKLLVARGFGGFIGLVGIYYSLQYLPLADATVITFLALTVSCWACSILIKEPFTRSEQIAGLISLVGVILIARPTSVFSTGEGGSSMASGVGDALPSGNATISAHDGHSDDVTPAQRLFAVGVALVGVLGAALGYTTIRWIGQSVHPLISVNYFAALTTFVTGAVLLLVPGMDFRLPSGLMQWSCLIFLGCGGFVMQLLLTAGLAYEKSSRGTNMVYTQMLFAVAFDKLVFNTTPGALSILGSSLILGSALYIAVQQDASKKSKGAERVHADEEVGLVGLDEGREPMRGR
ncbi:MAG: hypothetical protein LQ345_006309 [Seirophora villosa]|nr:MAG: hypothetical protein LQ345_006309 [Seirophora villosa]